MYHDWGCTLIIGHCLIPLDAWIDSTINGRTIQQIYIKVEGCLCIRVKALVQ